MSEKMKKKPRRVPPSLILVPAGPPEAQRSRSPLMRRPECDVCGRPSLSDQLRLCDDCKVIERLVGNDVALLCVVRDLIESIATLQRAARRVG